MLPVLILAAGIALIAGAVTFPASAVIGWILAVWGGFFTLFQVLVILGVGALFGLAVKDDRPITVTRKTRRGRR